MSSIPLQMALARLLIACAWADGKLDGKERNGLREMLLPFPGLGEAEWKLLQQELATPPTEAVRDAHFRSLQQLLRNEDDRQFAAGALEHFAAGSTSEGSEEKDALAELMADLKEWAPRPGMMKRTGRWLKSIAGQQQQRFEDYAKRFDKFEQGALPPLVAEVRDRVGDSALEGADLHRLAVAAALMARIARADNEISEAERRHMSEALQTYWKLGEEEAGLVCELVLLDASKGHDLYALLRDFAKHSDESERIAFLSILFELAAADGMATQDEIESIRQVARGFLLSHRHFIAAKLALPAERRQS